MHFAAPTFARTTPAKTRTTPAKPRTRPQIPKSPFWGISNFQISLWRGQFNKLVGGYFNKLALGDAEASPKLGTQCTHAWASPEFSENRVGCRLIRMFSRMRASAGVSREGQKKHGATRFPEACLDFPKNDEESTRTPQLRKRQGISAQRNVQIGVKALNIGQCQCAPSL